MRLILALVVLVASVACGGVPGASREGSYVGDATALFYFPEGSGLLRGSLTVTLRVDEQHGVMRYKLGDCQEGVATVKADDSFLELSQVDCGAQTVTHDDAQFEPKSELVFVKLGGSVAFSEDGRKASFYLDGNSRPDGTLDQIKTVLTMDATRR